MPLIDSLAAGLQQAQSRADLQRDALARLSAQVVARVYPQPLVPAAVLVPLVERADGWHLVLTRRTDHLRDHPGQISFPGGRLEPGDLDPAAAALREAGEEIGVGQASVRILGYLPAHAVITGFAVSPVVGVLRPDVEFRADPFEVAEVFTVPLDFLRAPASLLWSERTVAGLNLRVQAYQYGDRYIWGATAQIIATLCVTIDETNR